MKTVVARIFDAAPPLAGPRPDRGPWIPAAAPLAPCGRIADRGRSPTRPHRSRLRTADLGPRAPTRGHPRGATGSWTSDVGLASSGPGQDRGSRILDLGRTGRRGAWLGPGRRISDPGSSPLASLAATAGADGGSWIARRPARARSQRRTLDRGPSTSRELIPSERAPASSQSRHELSGSWTAGPRALGRFRDAQGHPSSPQPTTLPGRRI